MLFRSDEDCPSIVGHQTQLEQVLLNLITNARDAMRHLDTSPTSGKLIIRTRFDKSKDAAVLEVEDTGGGIDPKIQDRIFEPFFTTKEVGQGTGLGLSISYGIIADAGGTMSVENTREGACFRIFLPAAPASIGQPDKPISGTASG